MPHPVSPRPTTNALARLHYVIRAPHAGAREATIDAVPAPVPAQQVRGAFDDAVRAAQLLSAKPIADGIHRQPVNQAHAILRAGDDWAIVPLVADHRDRIGPVFIDGDFYAKAGLAVHAQRLDGALQAIVGAHNLIDLRGAPRAGTTPIPDASSKAA